MTEFLERALEEGARYGDDPWVFVRELIQNARDAGATRVDLRTEQRAGVERLECRDDGAGMRLDEARRYLLTLYATSKGGDGWAGRFGIGFWTVLAFSPTRIVVRSAARTGHAWELEVDGMLAHPRLRQLPAARGTTVVLERPANGADLDAAVRRTVAEIAPFPTTRHRRPRPLRVFVNGTPAGRPLALPPPSLSFRRRGLRGVVGLGADPGVELFAYGLKVRSAVFLDDLLSDAPPPRGEPAAGALPRALLDSDRLDVLLARGDARDDRALRRLVRVARGELRRLLAAELDRVAPLRWPSRLAERCLARRAGLLWGMGGFAVAVAAAALAWQLWGGARGSGPPPAPSVGVAASVPYRDPLVRYRGPQNDQLPARPSPVELSYRPRGDLLLGIVRLTGLDPVGAGPVSGALHPAAGPECRDRCVEVSLAVAGGGRLRLPVPPGQRVDPTSARLGAAPLAVREDSTGTPVVELPAGANGRLRYLAGPWAEPPGASETHWPALPDPLEAEVAGWEGLATSERVERATRLVRSRVRYRTGGTPLRSGGLLSAALAAGEGDCDVQNALLAAVLARLGLPARLAVGYVGSGGRVSPVLHAWVEYPVDGKVRVADASINAPPAALPAPAAAETHGLAANATVAACAVGGLLALVAALALARGRGERYVTAGDSDDGAELLRGVLLRERPWPGAERIERRPLVPLVGGGGLALTRARRLAVGGGLSASRCGSKLAREAAARGARIVDAARPAGQVVADALGLADVDALAPLLGRRRVPPLAASVNRTAARAGARWSVAVVDGVGASLTTVPVLPPAVTGAKGGLVLVDADSALWRAALERWRARPSAASFLVADAVLHQLLPPGPRRRRLLEVFARAAVEEVASAV